MKAATLLLFAVLIVMVSVAMAGDPVVSNVRASQRAGTKLVDIIYDVTATNALTITAAVSTNSGVTYDLPATHFSGDYGSGVAPGAGKAIVWDAGADWDGQYSTFMRIKITADDGSSEILPSDPATVATVPSNGVVTLIGASTAFLYTGANAIQTGVSTGAIDTLRVAVLRGSVLDISNAPLSGVTVTVNNQSELGQTLTRTNGAYDIALNGGGPVSLNFAKTGYLTIQRTLDVPWQDYVPVDDVVMMPADDTVNVVALPTNLWQAAVGTVVSDLNGTRRAVVLYPPDTRAWVFTSETVTQEVNALTTRFTEYTVGTNGPAAMPGDLSPMVAYTYCIALSADEAQIKVAGRDVLFNSNVFFYVDNFLGMPAGTAVPMGYYDESQAAWVPTQDGIVIQLLGTNASGLARLSVSTNGTEADAGTLAALGITDGERQQLAATYVPCTNSLWRTPIQHFSNRDLNYGPAPESGNARPNTPKPSTGQVNDPNGEGDYGRLDLENQVFQESIALAGTPFRLHYSSARVPGFQGQTSITIPLTGASYPGVLQRIHLKISIAGQNYTYYFAPSANLSYTFSWDGSDAYHRSLMGTMTATIRIGYEYRSFYALPIYMAASFGFPSGTLIPGNIIAPQPTILWQEHQVPLLTSSRSNGLGWWSLSEHHTYDPVGQVLHLGNGADRNAQASRALVIATFAGTGASGDSGNGGPATNALVNDPSAIAVAPNGDVYFFTESETYRQVRRVAATNGYIYNAAGRWGYGGAWNGEGGPATNALLGDNIRGLAVGPDSSLYICDNDNRRVLRVDTNGIIRTVAGNGTSGYSGDGGPATNAALNAPYGIAAATDGTLYISDVNNHCIRRVGPDGIISTLAGNGTQGFSGDGGPATNAILNNPYGIAMGPDGAVYVVDSSNVRVRRIGTDGIINTVAGNGTSGFSGDGGAATNAQLVFLYDLAVGSDGTLYLMANKRIREVTSDGIIRTIAGTGNYNTAPVVNNCPATAADFSNSTLSLAAAQDGSIYVSDDSHNMVRRISRNMPGMGMADLLIAAEDGNRFYQFDLYGRHLKTYHAWTGATLYEFGYTNGYLSTVTDGDGNVTRIVRDGSGTPQEIVTPDDQHTLLTLNANGFLSAVQNPAGETIQLGYTTNGLLTSVQGPKGASYTYTMAYNSTGQVVSASDPAGGSTSLRRSGVSNGYEVASTSALGRARTARVEFLPASDLRRTLVLADGTTQEQYEVSNGIQTNRYPSGVVERWDERPDPRFGMQAPVKTGMVVRLSSGLAMTTTVSKAAGLTNQSWTSVAYLTNTLTVNGRIWTASYSAANRQIQIASPLGRTYQIGLDSQGRRLWTQRPEMALVSNTFDGRGRLTGIRYGEGAEARQFTLTYDAAGYPGTLADPLGRNRQFFNDAIGRVTNMVRPDTQTIAFAYDTHGNRTSLTPPGRSAHSFAYDTVDQISSYTAPAADGVTNLIANYTYNADRQRLTLTRPDGKSIINVYNQAGQLTNQTTDAGAYGFTWSNGLARQITAPGGPTLNFGYDGFLITTMRWSGVVTGQVIYAYNNDFFVRSLTVNSTIITNGFDADGFLTNAGVCRLPHSAVNGLLTGIDVGQVTQALAYNSFAELTNLTAAYAGSNLFTETLAYDKAGRITSRVEIVQNTTNTFGYEYDAVSRLIRVVTNAAGTNTYQYDANGNRTNWVTSAGAFTATNDGQDRLIQWSGPAVTSQYTYSQAGDLTNRVVNTTNVTAYTYDAKGNLRQAILPGGITNDYIIDGLGRRVGKKVNGVFTNGWLYLNWLKPVAELDAGSNMVSIFVYGSRMNVPDYMVKTGVTYRIIADHLGSVRLVVREDTGEIAQRLDYDEWGRVLTNSAPGFQPFGFAGGLYDADTGLVRFGVRDYDPQAGRWTLKDLILFAGGGPNLYAYVGNNPINLTDVRGTDPNNNLPIPGEIQHDIPRSKISHEEYRDMREYLAEQMSGYRGLGPAFGGPWYSDVPGSQSFSGGGVVVVGATEGVNIQRGGPGNPIVPFNLNPGEYYTVSDGDVFYGSGEDSVIIKQQNSDTGKWKQGASYDL